MIRSVIIWITLFFFAFVLQTTLVPALSIFSVKPDLLILLLFFLAIKTGVMPAIYIGFLLGLAQDLYSPSILGQNALAKTIIGFVAGLFNEKVMRVDPLFQGVLVLFTFIINDTVFTTINIIKSGGSLEVLGSTILTVTLPRAVYSLLFALIPFFWEHYFKTTVTR
jgi:rod shape-determining protein MreD